MTSNDPDDIRRDIERTRLDLSENVDELTDRASPSGMVHRQTDKVRGAVSDVKEKVFGSVSDASDAVSEQAGHMAEQAGDMPERLKRKAEGNPLAAGLIAFAVGFLAAGMIPSSAKEREVTQRVKESDAASQVMDEAKSAAKDSAHTLQEPAEQAAQEVTDTASDGVSDVKDAATSAAQDAKEAGTESMHNLQDRK